MRDEEHKPSVSPPPPRGFSHLTAAALVPPSPLLLLLLLPLLQVALFSDLFTQLFPDVKIPKGVQWYLLVGCLIAGSFAFVLGGYLLCAAYERTWVPWRLLAVNPLKANLSWWIVILNMAGSLLFMLGAMPLVTPAPELLSPSFVQNLLGWACGSFLFFVQSWLMVIEVATAEDNESPDDEEFPLR